MEPIENNSLCELFKGTLGKCHEKGVKKKPGWQVQLDIEGRLQLSVCVEKSWILPKLEYSRYLLETWKAKYVGAFLWM